MIILFHFKIRLGNFNTWLKFIVWTGFQVSSFLTGTNVTSTFLCYKNLSWNLSVVFRIVSECVDEKMRYEGRRERWANVTATRPAVAASLVDQGMGGGGSGSRSSPQPPHAAPPPSALPLNIVKYSGYRTQSSIA